MGYKPKKSNAGWFGLVACVVIFGFSIWGINYALDPSDTVLKTMLLIPTYLFLALYVVIILGAFTLGYRVDDQGLQVKWGIYQKTIPWKQIDEIFEVKGKANLYPLLAASWANYNAGVFSTKALGSIRMFGTNIREGFIYIKSPLGFYGLTPADPGMVSEIEKRSGKSVQELDVNSLTPEQKGDSLEDDHSFKMYHRVNVFLIGLLTIYVAAFYPGSGAPKFVILLLILAIALFAFNAGNAKRIYAFSELGAYVTMMMTIFVSGIFLVLSVMAIGI
jgi:hypothetical protein